MSKAVEGAAMLGGAALIAAGMLFPPTAAFMNNPLKIKAMGDPRAGWNQHGGRCNCRCS